MKNNSQKLCSSKSNHKFKKSGMSLFKESKIITKTPSNIFP